MKSLPSLKEKKRYLVFEVIAERRAGFHEVKEAVSKTILGFVGSHGFARLKPRLLADRWDGQRQRGVIVVSRRWVDQLRSALCLVTEVDRSPAIVRTLGVSGILRRALSKFYLR